MKKQFAAVVLSLSLMVAGTNVAVAKARESGHALQSAGRQESHHRGRG